MNLIFTITLLLTINQITAIDIECTFKTSSVHGYGCDVKSIEVKSDRDCSIAEIEGHHESGLSNDDVKFINITSQTLKFFPKGLQQKFKNIQRIYIECEKLDQIFLEDLKPFGDDLTFLSLTKSSLEFIPSNLFEATTKISYLVIHSQKLKNIAKNAFNPILKNLKTFGINFNCSGEEFAQNNEDVKNLIANLEIQCFDQNYKPDIKPKDCEVVEDSSNLVYWIVGAIILFVALAMIGIIVARRVLKNRRGNFQMS